MNLSRSFTFNELVRTGTGLPNVPVYYEVDKLLYLCLYILQPIRDKWGTISISSGFRSIGVNMAVRGSASSQHLKGEAADIQPQANIISVYNWIMASDIKYGQLIFESKDNGKREWIHISLPRINKDNGQNLSIIDGVRKVITAPL